MRIYIRGHQGGPKQWPYIPAGWYGPEDIDRELFDYLIASGHAEQIEATPPSPESLPDLPFSEPVNDTDSDPDPAPEPDPTPAPTRRRRTKRADSE